MSAIRKSISLGEKYVQYLDDNSISLSKFIQRKLTEEMRVSRKSPSHSPIRPAARPDT